MTRHLCISVTLLGPLFHGKGDGDAPEWPPSPMRLFQALLAGSRTGCRNGDWSDAKAEAYRWLEQRNPPVIVGPTAQLGAEYRISVPNNDMDIVAGYWARAQAPPKNRRPENLRTMKSVRPHRIPSCAQEMQIGQTLHYVWAIAENEWAKACPHVELLCREARHLMALGWGIDQAVAHGRVLTDDEAKLLPGRHWRAWDAPFAGRQRLRVPKKGSLKDLERAYKAFLDRLTMRQPPKAREPRVFHNVAYLPVGLLPPRRYAAFELPEDVAFRQERTNEVAAMLRSLACGCAKADTHEFPGGSETYVAGHVAEKNGDTPPRFSYLPLPTIGHEHADGMIRRVLIAEPYGGDDSHTYWARERLRNQTLRDRDGNERGILLDLWRGTSDAMVKRYVEQSRCWSTVTPVVLPGFDDGKHAKAEKLLLQALEQAGLPVDAVAGVVLRKAPFWPGSQHPRHYHRPRYLKHLPAWHVRLGFRDPVPGPIALGAGRHCGLGLLARGEARQ